MAEDIDVWKTQVRKGYLELCLLLLIQKHKRIYGFDLLEKMGKAKLALGEGTLYPMLNRMTSEKLLVPTWETDAPKGHPRKFYSLTREGVRFLEEIRTEFHKMVEVFEALEA